MTSPAITQAAASTRTESQVREARNLTIVDTIRIGAQETIAAQPFLGWCPACGSTPKIDPSFYGKVCVYCDKDDCKGAGDGWPQAMGDTLALAAAKWNGQVEEL